MSNENQQNQQVYEYTIRLGNDDGEITFAGHDYRIDSDGRLIIWNAVNRKLLVVNQYNWVSFTEDPVSEDTRKFEVPPEWIGHVRNHEFFSKEAPADE